jgi:hypothetical protein
MTLPSAIPIVMNYRKKTVIDHDLKELDEWSKKALEISQNTKQLISFFF